MKRSLKPMPISSLYRRRPTIDAQPEYQRGLVWSVKQKQLLIDTILRDLDIPKLYFNSKNKQETGFEYEVVDGQQRLSAIWEFAENGFKLAKDADPVGDIQIAGKSFSELHEDLKDIFDSYTLDIIILDESSQDEIEEMFVRLQNGTTLKAAEKRNALPGKMKEFIRDVSSHKFFESVGFQNKRLDYQQISAQCMRLEIEGEATNIRNTDLEKMYLANQDLDTDGRDAKKLQRTFNFMHKAFPEKTPELKKVSVTTLYLLSSMLLEKYAVSGRESELGNWFIDFEQRRSAEMKKPEEERSGEMVSYQNASSHASDAVESLEYRYKVLSKDFFSCLPDLNPLDEKRGFDYEQKLAIFRRDNGLCQIKNRCDGSLKMGWEDDWHIDHIVPHSKGGHTTVENGQLACSACNLTKSNN